MVSLPRYDTDNPAHVQSLLQQKARPEVAEALPRQTTYASIGALRCGLTPIEAYPDVLVPQDAYKEVIEYCHTHKIFPMYHQRDTWAPEGFSSNQDGLGFCWTWSGTSWVMTIRAMEDKPTVMLSPVAQGKWVNWSNSGWYLDSFIDKARNEGICPLPPGVDFNSTDRSSSFWSQYDSQRKFYRVDAVWDCNNANATIMWQHAISCLAYGCPLYIAYTFWGHALMCVGVRWDNGQLIPVIQNSHGETDWIELTGSRAVFSEAYGGVSTVPVELASGSRFARSGSGLYLPAWAAA